MRAVLQFIIIRRSKFANCLSKASRKFHFRAAETDRKTASLCRQPDEIYGRVKKKKKKRRKEKR